MRDLLVQADDAVSAALVAVEIAPAQPIAAGAHDGVGGGDPVFQQGERGGRLEGGPRRIEALQRFVQQRQMVVFPQPVPHGLPYAAAERSEEHTSELQSLMRISYAVFC